MSDALPSFGPFLADLRIGMAITDPNAQYEVPEFDIVIKMPHVPMQTAQIVAERAGLRPKRRRIIQHPRDLHGLPRPGRLHIIEARNRLHLNKQDEHMIEGLTPYLRDDRYEIVWHDCDTVLGVTR